MYHIPMAKKANAEEWKKAKKICRLSDEDIAKAKRLGFSPKALIKNNPSPKEQWKDPVKVWIRRLYEEKFGKEEKKKKTTEDDLWNGLPDDLPF